MTKGGYVYMMANKRNGTIYTGVTNDLLKRIWQHKNAATSGFTETYNLKLLVWYEHHETIESAIQREKNIKHWVRAWKVALIEATNPHWNDRYCIIAP